MNILALQQTLYNFYFWTYYILYLFKKRKCSEVIKLTKKTCFVIMPFSATSDEHTEEYWTKHYEKYLKLLIEQIEELEAIRSKALRGDILKEIINSLITAPIVVADLTDANPNVYWELGVRQSFQHRTITIAEEGTKLPFDLGTKGTLFYHPKDHLKNTKFEEDFREVLKDCLKHPDRPDSHVLETISGRGTLYEILQREENIRRLDALLSELATNAGTLERVREEAQKEKAGEDFIFIASRLRLPAIELLVTYRYLDQDAYFYELVETCLDNTLQMNDTLSLWEQDTTGMYNEYILSSVDKDIEHIELLENRIVAIQTDLSAKL